LQIIFLIPFFISCYLVFNKKADKAFLNVYLPCLLMCPTYYTVRLPHLWPISPASGALIPIGLGMLFAPRLKWRLTRMDLWVLIFMVSIGLSETLREGDPKAGMLIWIQDFVEMFFAYIVGRQVIEPGLRLETVKRIIFLYVCELPFALYEYKMGVNPFLRLGASLGVTVGWLVQLRGGHARIGVVFAHAILSGIMFVVAIGLNHYLQYLYKQNNNSLGPRMSWLQRHNVPAIVLPGMLFLTGSRMPMACGVLTYMLMRIPSFKSMRTGIITMLGIVLIGGGIVYTGYQKYTTLKEGENATDEALTSALYRQQLLENYAPVLELGGWLGWGADSFPRVGGQISIDNNYLMLQLMQGKLGRYSFILLGLEAALTLSLALRKFQSRESQYIAFSIFTALIGIFVALTTVAMFEQVIQMLFLLLGWSQSLQDTYAFGARAAVLTGSEPKFRFRRVIA
jgi:hypothetical protein